MKQKTKTASKRPRRTGRHSAAQAARPLHKRVLLHPFSIMVLLCAGVLIAGLTFHGYAASYDVTATVEAPIPSVPAFVSNPINQQHFSTAPINVSGTCPAQSYVKLYRNSNFAGVAQCQPSAHTFAIQTDLSAGANQLQARVFNVTDQEGPTATSVTAYYDITKFPDTPPADTPTTLGVSGVEQNGYNQGAVQRVSDTPTLTGYAPPLSQVTVTFHSQPTTCLTQADSLGLWRCTLADPLPVGLHHVDITAVTSEGKSLTFPTFQINVLAAFPSVLTPPVATTFLLNSEYQYQAHQKDQRFSWTIGFVGGDAPFGVTVNWGDGQQLNTKAADTSPITLSHAYQTPGDYTVSITATDANGDSTILQLSAVVKGIGAGGAATLQGPLAVFLGGVKRSLWLIWPVYIVVILMALSYWLGEQEVYQRFMKRRRLAHHTAGKGRGR